MTPDTRMVTDAEAAAWLSWLDGVAPKPRPITTQGMLRAFAADRGRWMALARWASAEWPKHWTAEDIASTLKERARKLLKEAHGE